MLALGVACGSDDNSDGNASATGTVPSITGQSGTPTAAAGSISAVDITAKDFAFDAPDRITGGLVRFNLKNTGKESHQAIVVRLNQGVTQEQFQTALKSPDPVAVLPLVTFAGGPNTVGANGNQSVVDNLQQGQYAFLCFVSGDDDVPHYAKGMVKAFTVSAPAQAQAQPPEAKQTVNMTEYNFTGVDSLPAGKTTLQVRNTGAQPHELTVLKLEKGKTIDDLVKLLSSPGAAPAGPLPFEDAGGYGAVAPNSTGWVDLNLEAGNNYVFLCFVPDPAKGSAPHAALGMIKQISVQ
jgi:uncharacterized cupredoxin-like copper-binding protein